MIRRCVSIAVITLASCEPVEPTDFRGGAAGVSAGAVAKIIAACTDVPVAVALYRQGAARGVEAFELQITASAPVDALDCIDAALAALE